MRSWTSSYPRCRVGHRRDGRAGSAPPLRRIATTPNSSTAFAVVSSSHMPDQGSMRPTAHRHLNWRGAVRGRSGSVRPREFLRDLCDDPVRHSHRRHPRTPQDLAGARRAAQPHRAAFGYLASRFADTRHPVSRQHPGRDQRRGRVLGRPCAPRLGHRGRASRGPAPALGGVPRDERLDGMSSGASRPDHVAEPLSGPRSAKVGVAPCHHAGHDSVAATPSALTEIASAGTPVEGLLHDQVRSIRQDWLSEHVDAIVKRDQERRLRKLFGFPKT